MALLIHINPNTHNNKTPLMHHTGKFLDKNRPRHHQSRRDSKDSKKRKRLSQTEYIL